MFTIPYPSSDAGRREWHRLYGLNAFYGNNMTWHTRKRSMDILHTLVRARMRNAGIPQKPLEHPAEVTIYYNDRWDIDNHAILGKAIVDAMKGWVLQDDNRKYLVGVHHLFWDGDEIKVEVTET